MGLDYYLKFFFTSDSAMLPIKRRMDKIPNPKINVVAIKLINNILIIFYPFNFKFFQNKKPMAT